MLQLQRQAALEDPTWGLGGDFAHDLSRAKQGTASLPSTPAANEVARKSHIAEHARLRRCRTVQCALQLSSFEA
jgi:hypothetical protein